jgi:DNA-binding MurR/RpiR family transcriptional regulator
VRATAAAIVQRLRWPAAERAFRLFHIFRTIWNDHRASQRTLAKLGATTWEATIEPTQRRTIAYIRALTPSLIPSEALVAEALLRHVDDIADLSTAKLAAVAGTSPATVVRACQSLGYTGLNELRDALTSEARAASSPPDDHPVSTALDRSIAAGREQLDSMESLLDRDQFARAVDAIAEAGRVLIVTVSDLAFLGHYAVFHFALVGRTAEATSDVITLHALARLLRPGDVCLAVGHSGTNSQTIKIAEAARDEGATVIAVTSFPRGALADVSHIHLAVGTTRPDHSAHTMSRIRLGQMLIFDALQDALAARLGVAATTDSMLRTVTQYTYRRPKGPARGRRKDELP